MKVIKRVINIKEEIERVSIDYYKNMLDIVSVSSNVQETRTILAFLTKMFDMLQSLNIYIMKFDEKKDINKLLSETEKNEKQDVYSVKINDAEYFFTTREMARDFAYYMGYYLSENIAIYKSDVIFEYVNLRVSGNLEGYFVSYKFNTYTFCTWFSDYIVMLIFLEDYTKEHITNIIDLKNKLNIETDTIYKDIENYNNHKPIIYKK